MVEGTRFKIEGIIYTVASNHSVEVSKVDENKCGIVIVPECVENEGVIYTVTRIGCRAFATCQNIYSVVLPKSVHDIEEAAFCCCSALVSVNIPEGVKIIAYEAFFGCESLESLFIPDSVRGVEERGLWYCRKLETINIPKHLLGMEYPKILPKRALDGGQCRGLDHLKHCFVRCPSGEVEEYDVEY